MEHPSFSAQLRQAVSVADDRRVLEEKLEDKEAVSDFILYRQKLYVYTVFMYVWLFYVHVRARCMCKVYVHVCFCSITVVVFMFVSENIHILCFHCGDVSCVILCVFM